MGHAAGQGADRFHLLGVEILFFEFLVFGDVALQFNDLRNLSLPIPDRNSADIPAAAAGPGQDRVAGETGFEALHNRAGFTGGRALAPERVTGAAGQFCRGRIDAESGGGPVDPENV